MIKGLVRQDGSRLIHGFGCLTTLRYVSNGVMVGGCNEVCGIGCGGGEPRGSGERAKGGVLVLSGWKEYVGAMSASEHIGVDWFVSILGSDGRICE